jgi:hypothetical protein
MDFGRSRVTLGRRLEVGTGALVFAVLQGALLEGFD